MSLAELLSERWCASLPQRLAVGWSGGADSTALLLALKAASFQPEAWHIDHAWREGSADEARLLAERAAAWGIPFRSHRLPTPSGRNPEASARKGRFNHFLTWADKHNIDTIALGHHRDDQAETVCMRLLQGAGPAGCRGMADEREWQGVRLVRPLLELPARQLRSSLAQAGIDWLEDPSNSDTRLLRNHIRHRLFDRIDACGTDPATLFLRWQRQAQQITTRLDAASVQLTGTSPAIDWREWRAAEPAVRARTLQRLMATHLGEGTTPGRRHIELVEQWTRNDGRGGLDLSRCRLYRASGHLHLAPVTAACGTGN